MIDSPLYGATEPPATLDPAPRVSRRRTGAALLAAAALVLGLTPAAAQGAVDLAPPSLTGTAGESGWFVSDVIVKWTYSGETSTTGCDTQHLTADTPGATFTCTASDGTDSVSRTVTVRIDRTPPAGVVASPARPPDVSPFYTAPLPIAWSGTDVTSGIGVCTTLTYSGPDGPANSVTGTCRDRAGNVSAPVPLTFAYDTTPPALSDLVATAAASRYATLRWSAGADAQKVSVVRSPGDGGAPMRTVFDGPATEHSAIDGLLTAGMTYTYTVTVRDAAGNAASLATAATAPAPTTGTSQPKGPTKPKAKVKRPTVTWHARSGAKYYNLQLFRNGRKLLSAWPTTSHYTLKASWRYRGHTYKLTPGRYRWYVWPGYGPRSAHRYGKLLAKGAVTIPKA